MCLFYVGYLAASHTGDNSKGSCTVIGELRGKLATEHEVPVVKHLRDLVVGRREVLGA